LLTGGARSLARFHGDPRAGVGVGATSRVARPRLSVVRTWQRRAPGGLRDPRGAETPTPARPSRPEPASRARPRRRPPPSRPPRMRILLVEDERKVASFVRRGLEAERYTVDVASDGEAGLARALAEPYDLVILDVMLPGRDGLGVLRALRAAQRQVPVLLLTA